MNTDTPLRSSWNDPIDTEAARDPTAEQVDRQRRARIRRFLILVVVIVGATGIWFGYQGLVAARLAAYEEACQSARTNGNWPELERQAKAWSRWQPERTLPLAYAAEGAQRQGALKRAADYLREVPDGDPRTPAALLELSDLLFLTLNRPAEGAEVCQRILELEPESAEAHRRLVFFYAMTLQRQAMIRQARSAIDKGGETPETYIYLIGSDWLTFSNAYELNTRWLEADPDNELYLVARAIHYAGAKGIAAGGTADDPAENMIATKREHEKILGELLQRFPQNLELLAYFLKESCTGGDTQRVAELLSQAPQEALDDSRFWRFKGWLDAALGNLPAAKYAYERALDLHPFDWHSQHELAGVLRRLGEHERVDGLGKLSMEGKSLRKVILELPDVQSAPIPVMRGLAEYARNCGDVRVAECLVYRLQTTQ